MRAFISPTSSKEIATKLLTVEAEDIIEACHIAVCGDPGPRVIVPFPSRTSKDLLDVIRTHIEISGWTVTFFNGQQDINLNGTYNMELKRP